jgi:AcrR family transcriptional regulator
MKGKRNTARDMILETADRLFYTQGYHATGINQIIDEAATAKASFYQHFPSKEALGQEYLHKRHQEWRDDMIKFAGPFPTAREKLLGMFTHLEQRLNSNQLRGCAFLNIASEFPDPGSPVREIVKQHKQQIRELMLELAGQLDTPAEINKVALGNALYLLYEASIVESQVYHDLWPVRAARETAEQLLA